MLVGEVGGGGGGVGKALDATGGVGSGGVVIALFVPARRPIRIHYIQSFGRAVLLPLQRWRREQRQAGGESEERRREAALKELVSGPPQSPIKFEDYC